MAVSTPGTNRIRCFDVYSGIRCPDIVGGDSAEGDEIHGLVNASYSSSSDEDKLAWMPEKDAIQSKKWAAVAPAKAIENDSEEDVALYIGQ